MSNKFSRTPATLALNILPSRRLRDIYFCLTLLAVLAIASSGVSLFNQIILTLFVLIYWALLQRRQWPVALRFNAGWYLKGWGQVREGSELELQLHQATVWPMLIVLRFRDPQYSRLSWRGSYSLVLLPDNLSADDWRHLRIYLRHYNVFGDLSFDDIN